ncbi:hypothetical protein FC831_10455 [Clostridium botulinum]|nr:hypothetical protein [Clostridium botulinum]
MDFEKIKKEMTKEEFLNYDELGEDSGCPEDYGLIKPLGCLEYKSCRDCWEETIEEGNVKFKGDIDMENKTDNCKEKQVIEALELVSNFCKDINCSECKFQKDFCKIKEFTSNIPMYYKIRELKNIIEEPITIYKVEHIKGGKLYDFVSSEKLKENDMVCCDTKLGETYGKVIKIIKDKDNNYKQCWKVK